MPLLRVLFACAAALISTAATAADRPPPADPLTVTVQTRDAERFAALFDRTGGKPTAAQIQAEYLDGASYGVEVFTPYRIRDAQHLADAVARNPAAYRRAIDVCLPEAVAATVNLRTIYLAMRGLLPKRPLPQIYVVFGSGSSGGTAGPGAQVLGLEVICGIADTKEEIRAAFRTFFAHETVHTFQRSDDRVMPNLLLFQSLREGAADFIAELVTGAVPNPARDAWARPREAAIWQDFQRDTAIVAARRGNDLAPEAPATVAFSRWIGNAFNAPPGWPSELGYWVGMRIHEAYFARAKDKAKAIEAIIAFDDPEAILRDSGYADDIARLAAPGPIAASAP